MDFSYFEIAAKFAAKRNDERHHRVGALGIRNDGVIVVSRNSPTDSKNKNVHAEARLCGKLTKKSIVYVSRPHRSGGYGNAKPCPACEARMKPFNVAKVYYTLGNSEYGCIVF